MFPELLKAVITIDFTEVLITNTFAVKNYNKRLTFKLLKDL